LRAKAIDGDIGILRISKFSEKTYEDLAESIEKIKAEIGADDVAGYIVDLRNNPGGLLTQAVAVSDAFLDQGEIVSTRGRDQRNADRYNAQDGDLADGKPIVVLVNGGSASASEARGAIRLTTAKYYTPSGRSIQALGIEPDILVEQIDLDEEDGEENERSSYSEAQIRGSLQNDTLSDEELEEREATEEENRRRADIRSEDYQLAYAIDLIQGLSVYTSFAAE